MPYAERTIASAAIVIGALRVKYKTHCLHRRITQRIDLSAKAHQGRKLKKFLLIFIFVNDTYNTSKYRSPRFTRLTAERSTETFGQYRLISLHRESGN